MAADDNISFSTLAHSEQIRNGLIARNIEPFLSDTAVSAAVKRYAQIIREKNASLLIEKLKNDIRFSVTTDEYTTIANERMACFNVHFPHEEPISIGSSKIRGTFDGDAAAKVFEKKLEEYGLTLKKDIVAGVTDAASVMQKMGEFIKPVIHQLCFSHGIHLAVCDVIYKVSHNLFTNVLQSL